MTISRRALFGKLNLTLFRSIESAIISDWTGIPVGRMVKDEVAAVFQLQATLDRRVIGQARALAAIAERVQTARARLTDPNKPVGVFLLVGPSGVGKTETALTLAEAMYGGEQNLITINMSEFQEAHTISTLKGAPPGYVGYGEGGVLTEADFSPAAVARKIEPLKQLLDARTQLSNLQTYMDGKAGAESLINKLMQDPALMKALSAHTRLWLPLVSCQPLPWPSQASRHWLAARHCASLSRSPPSSSAAAMPKPPGATDSTPWRGPPWLCISRRRRAGASAGCAGPEGRFTGPTMCRSTVAAAGWPR